MNVFLVKVKTRAQLLLGKKLCIALISFIAIALIVASLCYVHRDHWSSSATVDYVHLTAENDTEQDDHGHDDQDVLDRSTEVRFTPNSNSDNVTQIAELQTDVVKRTKRDFNNEVVTVSGVRGVSDETLPVAGQDLPDPIPKKRQKTVADLARENLQRMKSDSVRCSNPKPKVIKVQDSHPHPYKRYVPSCIVLHRCAKDTGCCDDAMSICSPRRRKKVTLHFYVVSLAVPGNANMIPNVVSSGSGSGSTTNQIRNIVESSGKIDALQFTNHTECECRRRKILRPPPPLTGPRDLQATSGSLSSYPVRTFVSPVAGFAMAMAVMLRRSWFH